MKFKDYVNELTYLDKMEEIVNWAAGLDVKQSEKYKRLISNHFKQSGIFGLIYYSESCLRIRDDKDGSIFKEEYNRLLNNSKELYCLLTGKIVFDVNNSGIISSDTINTCKEFTDMEYNKYVNKLIKIDNNDLLKQVKWISKIGKYRQNKKENSRVLSYLGSSISNISSYDEIYSKLTNMARDINTLNMLVLEASYYDLSTNGTISDKVISKSKVAFKRGKKDTSYLMILELDSLTTIYEISNWINKNNDYLTTTYLQTKVASILNNKGFNNNIDLRLIYSNYNLGKYDEALTLFISYAANIYSSNKILNDEEIQLCNSLVEYNKEKNLVYYMNSAK